MNLGGAMDPRELVVGVLQALQKRGAPLTKIMIHKFTYYLDVMGVRAGFHFEPYTYGPFSFDLARTLNTMVFWDELQLQESKNAYEIQDVSKYPPLEDTIGTRIDEHLKTFHEIAGSFGFDDLECAGTTLYCAESLASQGASITARKVEKEFKAWKGEKYPTEKIRKTFERLEPHLPFS
ncbi:hypothetical protein ASZ90_000584 [hydrocarbon metagenome]|uniref:Antitoxin SocA-like Panacea domain-containing protein n=1 Tax=hydrocarbon metagenome TaxID=938273 RepID=A0A0W8G8V0_9ZZZZ